MKKIVLAIGVLFLVGTGCVSNTAQPTKEVVAPTPLVQPVPVVVNEEKLPATAPTQEKMLTYKNKLYGFQFSYPADAKLTVNVPKEKNDYYQYAVGLEFSSSSSAYFYVYNNGQKIIPDRKTSPNIVYESSRVHDGLNTKQYIYQFHVNPINTDGQKYYFFRLNEYTEIGSYIIEAFTVERPSSRSFQEFLDTNIAVKAIESLSVSKDYLDILKGQESAAILEGLKIDSHSNLVFGDDLIMTREKMLENVYGQDGEDFNLKDYEETGFVETNKYIREGKIYLYLAAAQGCGGCFSPNPTYLAIDPADGSVTYKKLDPTKNPFLFGRIPELVISPDKLKGAYVSNDPGSQNNPKEPEVVWVIDFTTGVSTIYKKLPLGQTIYEIGGSAWSGGRLKWSEDSSKLIIKTIKREE